MSRAEGAARASASPQWTRVLPRIDTEREPVPPRPVAMRAGHSDAYTASTNAVLRGSFAMWGPIRFIT